MNEFPVHTKGFLCRLFSISRVKPKYLRSFLGHFILAESPEAMEHGFNPPIASYSTEYRICPGVMIHYSSLSKMYRNFFIWQHIWMHDKDRSSSLQDLNHIFLKQRNGRNNVSPWY